MDKNDKIQKLRREIQGYEDAFVELAVVAQTPEEVESFDLLAMELHDLDRTLFESIFINNNSKIKKLINEITESTIAGERILHQFKKVREALTEARKVVQDAAPYIDKANELMKEVDEMVELGSLPSLFSLQHGECHLFQSSRACRAGFFGCQV